MLYYVILNKAFKMKLIQNAQIVSKRKLFNITQLGTLTMYKSSVPSIE